MAQLAFMLYVAITGLLLVSLPRIARSVASPYLRLFIRASLVAVALGPSAAVGEGAVFAPLPIMLVAVRLKAWPGVLVTWLYFAVIALVVIQIIGSICIARSQAIRYVDKRTGNGP